MAFAWLSKHEIDRAVQMATGAMDMQELMKKSARTRMLVALALAMGSTSAVLAGTFAAFTVGTGPVA